MDELNGLGLVHLKFELDDSIQTTELSFFWPGRVSNPQPFGWKSGALPLSQDPHM